MDKKLNMLIVDEQEINRAVPNQDNDKLEERNIQMNILEDGVFDETVTGSLTELYKKIVNESQNTIYVNDVRNYELLYVNETGLDFIQKEDKRYEGKKCYEYLYDRTSPCLFCKLHKMREDCFLVRDFSYKSQGKILNLRGKLIKWRGINAHVEYITDVTEERNRQNEIQQLQQKSNEAQLRYEVAIKSAGINIWEYNIIKDELMVVSNSSRIKQNCFVIENYIESTIENGYVREDSIDKFRNIFKRLKNGDKEVTEDIWYKTDGESGWWCERVTYTSKFDKSGNPIKAFGAGRDVTREKDAEKKFKDEMSYREAMQSSNMESIKLDLTNNIILDGFSNFKVFNDIVSINNVDGYFKKTIDYIVGKEYKEEFKQRFNRKTLLNKFSSGEYVVSMELKRIYDNSKIYWIDYSIHMMQNPDTREIIAFEIVNDITEEKVMRVIMDIIAKSDYDFFVIVDGSVNSAGDYGNRYNKKMFAENEPFEEKCEQIIRKEVCAEDVDRVVAECKIDNILKKISGGNVYKFNFSVHEESGEIRRKQLQLVLIDQNRKTFLMTRIDVHNVYIEQQRNQRRLEEALLEAKEASRVKSDFLAKMSHDIRTPMNAIIGMVELAKYESNTENTIQYLNNIDSSSHFLLGLINDILDISKIENGNIELHEEPFSIEDFRRNINTVITPLMEAKNIDFKIELNCGADCIITDKLRYSQIYFNLLSNAVKFTPVGGKVEFITEKIPSRNGMYGIKGYIRDNGIGMSEEFLKRLFEPFSQEKKFGSENQQGTGLGLAIVKNLVEIMGGNIKVKSELGKGTEFAIEMYVKEADKAETVTEIIEPIEILKGSHILLVEDNELNILVAQKLLEIKGCIVDVAKNGKLAVDRFDNSEEYFYDTILMDVRMPVMGGIEATESIRKLHRNDVKTVPIIAMTADAFVEDQNKTKEAGMNAHLAKPIEPNKLYGKIAELIENRE